MENSPTTNGNKKAFGDALWEWEKAHYQVTAILAVVLVYSATFLALAAFYDGRGIIIALGIAGALALACGCFILVEAAPAFYTGTYGARDEHVHEYLRQRVVSAFTMGFPRL